MVEYIQKHRMDVKQLKPYNFRHSFACSYLDYTRDIFGCAMMMGTSVKMLKQSYFHMDEDKLHEKFLRYHESVAGSGTCFRESGVEYAKKCLFAV